MAEDWVATINSADDAAYLRFIEERGPRLGAGMEPLVFRDFLRGMELCGIKSATADAVEVWVFDPKLDTYGIWRFKPAAAKADKIEFLGGSFSDQIPPGATPPPKLAVPALAKAIDENARSRAKKDEFSGAILLAKNGRIVFQKAYGLADREHGTPNTLEAQFRFGSMGKMFTAVAVMQLVEKGKIALEAPIGRYLPDYPNTDIRTKVTVANLLTHTGGTGDIFGPEFDENKASLSTTKDYVDFYGSRAPQFVPGARRAYSNFGFILLGRIVERVSGLEYDEYVQRNIFMPAGMESTGNEPESRTLPRRAVGYMGSGARLKNAREKHPLKGTAAGGGYSTVGDFHRFMRSLTSHRLLRRETLERLINDGVRLADGEFVHFDFGGAVPHAGRWIGHAGGAPGISGTLQHFVSSGVTFIILSNRDADGGTKGLAMFIEHRMPAK